VADTVTATYTLTVSNSKGSKSYNVSVFVPSASGVNYCLDFNGTSSYVEIPSSSTLNITGNVTMEAFIKVRQFSTIFPYQMEIVSKIPDSGWGSGWEMWIGGNSQHQAEFDATPGGTNSSAYKSIDNSSWYHVGGGL